MSKRQIGAGLVRISAGLVGIVLLSCCQRALQRLTPESGVALRERRREFRMNYGVTESDVSGEGTVLRRVQGAIRSPDRALDVNQGSRRQHAAVKFWLQTKITGVAYRRSYIPTRTSLRMGQDPGDTLSGLLPRRHERPVQSAAGS
jgi:hypothetical protein